ncbi:MULTISPECIES: hypothetical protein [unclassified Synechococcus]|uniref:hypothetical protein n=1 Tax=unclassified Synechococcus TaxID=2626047 RepID=UPI002000F27D|nr:hypothetical protein [Synechococcus sp. A10-1-5-1]UPM50378.1 hypothetical protein MY494_00805 [Synechococcus sp. A10-1-5-1]
MADGDFQRNSGDQSRDNRGPREGGGFRIRLSDNEMRAARAVQEAFGVRSTVAALGLSLRTVAQLIEEGRIDDIVAQQKASAGSRGRGERSDRRGGSRGERSERPGNRPNPFARPAKPPAPVAEEEPVSDSTAAASDAAPAEATADAVEASETTEA